MNQSENKENELIKKFAYYQILKALSENQEFEDIFNEYKSAVSFQLGLLPHEAEVFDIKKIARLLKPMDVLFYELNQYKKQNEKESIKTSVQTQITSLKPQFEILNQERERKFQTKTLNFSNEDSKLIEENLKHFLKTGSYDDQTYPDYITVDFGMINTDHINIAKLNPYIFKRKYLIPKNNLL
jgi:hypothetical protein